MAAAALVGKENDSYGLKHTHIHACAHTLCTLDFDKPHFSAFALNLVQPNFPLVQLCVYCKDHTMQSPQLPLQRTVQTFELHAHAS